MTPLDLPPIPGKKPKVEVMLDEDGEEIFDFEAIPFKADYQYHAPDQVRKLLQNGAKTLGTPAASLSWGIDGNRMIPALEAGKEGEKMTASILDRLAENNKNLFAFHSLSWPESAGDTDHVLVYGDLIIVIDSKRWKASRKYSVKPNGQIIRGTVPFESGKVRIGSAVQVWKKKFPNMKVTGVVNIAQEKVFVVKDKNWYKAPFRLVTNDTLEEFLEEVFAKNPPKKAVSGKTLVDLGMLLVKAKDKREGLIRIGGEKRENDFSG